MIEVTRVSRKGFWLLTGSSVTDMDDGSGEVFLAFRDSPWFEGATIAGISNVKRTPNSDHFSWPDLDADLDLDTIRHLGRCPLGAVDSRAVPGIASSWPGPLGCRSSDRSDHELGQF